MKRKIIWAFCLILLSGCARREADWRSPYTGLGSLHEGDIVHLSTGVKVTQDQLINIVSCARIVYVGEAHDNAECHEVQLSILKDLSERYPGEIAVGMEMLQRPSQEAANQWVSGELDEKSFVKVWIDNWSDNFNLYRDILHYVQDRKIPVVALRASDEWLEEVRTGETDGRAENAEDALPELDLKDPYYRSHLEAVFKKHPHGGKDFESFYRVQVLWDESMAQSVVEFLESEKGQDKRILVFAGSHHVEYGYGIPRRVFRRLPIPYAIVLPITIHMPENEMSKLMDVKLPEIPLRPGDFVWIVGYDDLSDQKVYLGVMIRDTDEGVKVMGALKNSTAREIGVEKGDIIIALDDEPIKTKFDLTYLLGLEKPGDQGVLKVLRDGQPLSFDVTFQSHSALKMKQ